MVLVKVRTDCKHDIAADIIVLKYVHVFLVFLLGVHEEQDFPSVACLKRNMILLLLCHRKRNL